MSRKSFLTTTDLHRLSLACVQLKRFAREAADGGGVYLVGSAGESADFRDVDVRMILPDEGFDRLFGHSPELWGVFCYAVSRMLAADTGLPIDFQVQRQTEANERFTGHRNALGITARDFAGLGDATSFVQQSTPVVSLPLISGDTSATPQVSAEFPLVEHFDLGGTQ